MGTRSPPFCPLYANVISTIQEAVKFFEVVHDGVFGGPKAARIVCCAFCPFVLMPFSRYAVIGMIKSRAAVPVRPEYSFEPAARLSLRPVGYREKGFGGRVPKRAGRRDRPVAGGVHGDMKTVR